LLLLGWLQVLSPLNHVVVPLDLALQLGDLFVIGCLVLLEVLDDLVANKPGFSPHAICTKTVRDEWKMGAQTSGKNVRGFLLFSAFFGPLWPFPGNQNLFLVNFGRSPHVFSFSFSTFLEFLNTPLLNFQLLLPSFGVCLLLWL